MASNEELASGSAALSAAVFAVCAVRDEHAAQVAKVEAAFAVRRRRVRRQSRKRTARSRLVVLMRLWQALVQTFLRYLWDAELEALMRLWDSHASPKQASEMERLLEALDAQLEAAMGPYNPLKT